MTDPSRLPRSERDLNREMGKDGDDERGGGTEDSGTHRNERICAHDDRNAHADVVAVSEIEYPSPFGGAAVTF